MNIHTIDFLDNNGIIKNKYFCLKNGGENIIPELDWEPIKDISSYALIMEDTKAVFGTVVHWFIPTITKNIIIEGKNFYNKFGYYGPCAPKNTGTHEYNFILYSLDKILDFDLDAKINSSIHFEKILQNNNIKILHKSNKIYYYCS